MNSTAIAAVLALIEDILPLVSSSKTVTVILNTLAEILPAIVAEAADLVQPVKNIIAALTANDAATADQLAALKAMDAQADAAFDAQEAAYLANHPGA
jgi:hypothetical protein